MIQNKRKKEKKEKKENKRTKTEEVFVCHSASCMEEFVP